MLLGPKTDPNAVHKSDVGNAMIVYPGDDLAAKYNWLKSSDRDAKMGALSSTNPRTLILAPGGYTLTSALVLDTDYVNIIGLASPEDTVVAGAMSSTIVEQTANTISLANFTIQNTNADGGDGLKIDAADNSDSVYKYMNFWTVKQISSGVYGMQDINGTWEFCNSDDFAWVCAPDKKLSATMFYCTAGFKSYAGDNGGVEITGTLKHCTGGDQSFGGCGMYGCPISGQLEDCEAGYNSYAMGKEFSGVAIRCKGGTNCFGGWKGSGTYYGTFSGYVEDCQVVGGFSFGTGHASCVLSGQLRNCIIGSTDAYSQGVLSGSSVAGVTDNGAAATLTTNQDGDNNDLKFTARAKGPGGNDISIEYYPQPIPPLVGKFEYTGLALKLYVKSNGTTTANEVTGYFEADGLANSLVAVENAPGNDGSGAVGSSMSATFLTGGVRPPGFKGNCPWAPVACTADSMVRALDNGCTYTNEGAGGTITFSLPASMPGLEYRFILRTAQQLRIDPYGTETIALSNGQQQGAGKYIWADAIGESCLIKCVEPGKWEHWDSVGTWTAEP